MTGHPTDSGPTDSGPTDCEPTASGAPDYSALQRPAGVFPLIRHLSYPLTLLLLRLPVTPNQVTSVSLLLGLGGAACFLAGSWTWGVLGAALLVAGYVLDNCDGEIARVKKLSSPFGARLDDLADWLVDACFFAALGAGEAAARGESLWLWLGLAAAAGATIDYVVDLIAEARARRDPAARSREQQASEPKRPETALDWVIYVFHKLSRADFCLIVLALALLDLTWVLLPLGAIGAQAYWIADLFPRARGYHT